MHTINKWATRPKSNCKKKCYAKWMVDTKTDIDQNLLYGRSSILSPLETPDCPFTVPISRNKTQEPQPIKDFWDLLRWKIITKLNFCSSWTISADIQKFFLKSGLEEQQKKTLTNMFLCSSKKAGAEKLSKHGSSGGWLLIIHKTN